MKERDPEGKKLILIVEDDPHSQLYFERLLSGSYNVRAVFSARDAWEMVHLISFDLILMDISLSGGEDGLSLTQRIRQEEAFSKVPILAVTAYAFPEDRDKALAAGCTDYLSKPVNSNELLKKVSLLLSRQAL